ncbi:MAG: IMP dehydrogenase, partial [Fibrobacteres bacterium]|nr:IMP dehydrogenase [Fibrobacterota bacterium]
MSKILNDTSRTFSEYLLIPGLTEKHHVPSNVNLSAPVSTVSGREKPRFSLNIPIVSAAMQAVSGTEMAISLARRGGMAFLFCSQTIESQANMVSKVKSHKAGFVKSDTNIKPTSTLRELMQKMKESGHSTVPVTEDGQNNGKLVGLITDKDFWEFEDDLNDTVSKYMTPMSKVIHGTVGITLKEANALLHRHKKECLPILEKDGTLNSL